MTPPPFFVTPPSGVAVPLLVSIPHTGVEVDEAIASRFADDKVRALPDTDWNLHRLYGFVPELGATLCCARFSRYVIDLNRPSDGHALYPGRAETELVPTKTFAGDPIYRSGDEPTAREIAERVRLHWQPYHDFLRAELDRIRTRHGYALLFEAHSIASFVPRFSAQRLPGFMLGDVDGGSCAVELSDAVFSALSDSGITTARNKPFKGGYITRALGRPHERVHALQLEMSQRLYMEEGPPFAWSEDLASSLRPVLRAALTAFVTRARTIC